MAHASNIASSPQSASQDMEGGIRELRSRPPGFTSYQVSWQKSSMHLGVMMS